MGSTELYVTDANALIQLCRQFGKKAIRKLRTMAEEKTLRVPEGVVREILRGADQLARFVKKYRPNLEVSFKGDASLIRELSRIERTYGDSISVGDSKYPGLWNSPGGRKSADAQVIALAIVLSATVISDDRAVQTVCSLEGIPCIGWIEFAGRIGLKKPTQPSLFAKAY